MLYFKTNIERQTGNQMIYIIIYLKLTLNECTITDRGQSYWKLNKLQFFGQFQATDFKYGTKVQQYGDVMI